MRAVATVPGDAAAPLYRRFRSGAGEHLLVVPFTRVFDLPPDLASRWDADPGEAARMAATLAERAPGEAELDAVVLPSAQSLSLNVASACNLSCGYCYADRGGFGGRQSRPMTLPVAQAAVDRLLARADPSAPVTVGFLGGEPLLNRALVHAVVGHAEAGAARRGLDLRFSMTTNGTLLTAEDIAMMRPRRFALTVSVDGDAATHDRQRPRAGRKPGGFGELARRVAPLLAEPGRTQVAARMTVRAGSLDLSGRIDAVLALGFREVGVSPLRAAADGTQLGDSHWPDYLAALTEVGGRETARALRGEPIRLTNLAVALKQIHAGASSPFPCGAGGGYFSVSAEGLWYACHRAIGDEAFALGDSQGLAETRRADFLAARHVHAQTDCRACWARYLCSGGCHQEAAGRSSAGCDFVRDWLLFCLAAYCEIDRARPDFFGRSSARH